MSTESRYPYELKNNFFASISFERQPEVPQPLNVSIEIEINIAEPKFPILQLGIKVKTEEDSPVSFNLQLFGTFEYQGDKKEYDHDLNAEYAFERGLYLLWPNINQMVRTITAQMGINPIQVRTPIVFGSKESIKETS